MTGTKHRLLCALDHISLLFGGSVHLTFPLASHVMGHCQPAVSIVMCLNGKGTADGSEGSIPAFLPPPPTPVQP